MAAEKAAREKKRAKAESFFHPVEEEICVPHCSGAAHLICGKCSEDLQHIGLIECGV